MSERPTDWSALDYGSDPVPGDPAQVRADGQHYLDTASAMGRISGTLGALSTGATTGSRSVESLMEGAGQVRADVDAARGRYQAAGDALVEYAHVHDAAQQTTLRALYAARAAKRDAADAQALARSRDRLARQAATAGDQEQAHVWTRRADASRQDAADAAEQVGAQRRIAEQAVADWDRAARAAVSKIDAATSADGLDDSWWDDWGAKALKVLADVAEWVSSIAGVLALLVCWIPIVGQALAATLLLISAISALVAAVANVVLAATGEQSWTAAIVSIIGTVLACVGLGALKGAFGTLKVAAGAWKTAGGVAGLGGTRAIGAATLKNFTSSLKNVAAGIKRLFGTFAKRARPTPTSPAQVIASRVKDLDLTPHPPPFKQAGPRRMATLKDKITARTATKAEYKEYTWNTRIDKSRKAGVRRFWEQEQQRLESGAPASRDWSQDQIDSILAGKAPKLNGSTLHGHHSYSVSQYPHLASRGEVIWPTTAREHFAGWHGGNWKNSLPGQPIDPSIIDF